MSAKCLLLGVTGGIAAYKTPELVRQLTKQGYEVQIVMTEAAKAFVSPLVLQALSARPVRDSLLDMEAEFAMGHIELSRWADKLLIAPATADFIAKAAIGQADDLLSTICLAFKNDLFIAPAMNSQMWHNSATQNNIQILQSRGIKLIGPESGELACREVGLGRMSELTKIVQALQLPGELSFLNGKHILVNAGPTQEPLCPVRFLTNRSSGKMGYALARAATRAGAKVTLVSGPTSIEPPAVDKLILVNTAIEMQQAVMAEIDKQALFIAAAAVSDYRAQEVAPQKIKKQTGDDLTLKLIKNPDIVKAVANLKNKPIVIGFAAETEHVIEHAKNKLERKNLDAIIVNDVSKPEIGFDVSDNAVTYLSHQQNTSFPKMDKEQLAEKLLQIIAKQFFIDNALHTKKRTEECLK